MHSVPAPSADTRGAVPARSAGIAGIAMATPPRVLANRAIAARLRLDDGWIEARTGIDERHYAEPGDRLTDLATRAGEQALADAGVAAGDVDLVLVATTTPDQVMPNTAPLVAHELGIPTPGAIDVGAACTGFLAALAVAAGQVEIGRAEVALVVGADLMSRVVDPDDRNTSVLFGDGAGAAVVAAHAGSGRIGPSLLHSDGAGASMITLPRTDGVMRMAGQDIFRAAVDRLSESTVAAAERAGLALDQIDLFVYHQANGRILSAVGRRLGLDPDRVVDCISGYGNTSAASIPIALCEARQAGRLFDGAKVLLGAFAAGYIWGAAVVEWGET